MTNSNPTSNEYILVIKCPDRRGVVAAVSGYLADIGASIVESNHFNNASANEFYMRTVFRPDADTMPAANVVEAGFAAIAVQFRMEWTFHAASARPRVVVAVSKFGHCLNDLLHRWRSDLLPVEIVGVISNHDALRPFVEWNGIPYHFLPIAKGGKVAQEERFLALIDGMGADLVVLARYMQILSPEMCKRLAGRCINIHHSFLPSFKGAKPYHQAFERGVKIIGATAHYVTTDLDEGPIIEQGVQRVDHGHTPDDLVKIGQDIECSVLARAVAWHAERRVILNGVKTVVFSR